MTFTLKKIFETNILNLIVVLAIVVKLIGGIANSFLTKRKERIIEHFIEVDTKQRIADIKLENARLAVKEAEEYCCIIHEQGQKALAAEKIKARKLLERELQRIEAEHIQIVQCEEAQKEKTTEELVLRIALEKAKQTLIKCCKEMPLSEEKRRLNKKLRTIKPRKPV
uniref:ATP synthase CF0 B chain n=1 Tax=Lepidodinium chlorophorum TaxID=107758 RepID=A0A0F7R0Y5_LEPCH|nr:ATP synthase CF0 B chain [Lepidodinium chlorophorum]BAR72345.1 ATP synthase CF0 B chain [Lepidodinium chlorophorum]